MGSADDGGPNPVPPSPCVASSLCYPGILSSAFWDVIEGGAPKQFANYLVDSYSP
jgi:hypothetical protein